MTDCGGAPFGMTKCGALRSGWYFLSVLGFRTALRLRNACHSPRSHVIPSAARNLGGLQSSCYVRFFTSLRSVQNDKFWRRYVQVDKLRGRSVRYDKLRGRSVRYDKMWGAAFAMVFSECIGFRMALGLRNACHSERSEESERIAIGLLH